MLRHVRHRRMLMILLAITLLCGAAIFWPLRTASANHPNEASAALSHTKLPRRTESAEEHNAREQRELQSFQETIESFLNRQGRNGASLIAVLASCPTNYVKHYEDELQGLRDDPVAVMFFAMTGTEDYSAACRFRELEPDNAFAHLLVVELGLMKGIFDEEQAQAQLLPLAKLSHCNRHIQEVEDAFHALAISLCQDQRSRWKQAYGLRRMWEIPRFTDSPLNLPSFVHDILNDETQDSSRRRVMADAVLNVSAQFARQGEWEKSQEWLYPLNGTSFSTPQVREQLETVEKKFEREELFSAALKIASEEQLKLLDNQRATVGSPRAIQQLIDSLDPKKLQHAHEAMK